ncbi:MAG: hypothetical protein DLM60_19825 [Pseudonocardiales bacterium]|nr:MAG: hypothetical protein DLM60_19825 [Pseudonocardiales bacterium]
MSRCVGISVGGDSVRAVVAGADRSVSPVSVPAVLVLAPGAGALVGAQAERFAAPGGAVFRDFTGRVGDPVPVVGSDGSARLGADLVAMTIGGVLRRCAASSDLAHLAIAHPSDWGPYEVSVLRSALTCTEAEGLPTSLVSSPVATVTAAVAAGVMRFSETVIVADIGGHGTEVALVTGAENQAGRLEATSRTDDLSSAELDRALARHVLEQVRSRLPAPDLHDQANRAIVRGVVAACRVGREDLVRHTSTVIDVSLPSHKIPVRVVRAEFESLIREPILGGLSAIAHLMDQARENGIKVDAILLTGEVARTPLLSELLSAQSASRVVIPPFPEWAAASGAAHIAARRPQPRVIAPRSPARPNLPPSQPRQSPVNQPPPPRRSPKTPSAASQAVPAVPHVRSTGKERKWTLRWGALQVTAALISNSQPQPSGLPDYGLSRLHGAVPRHG